MSCQPYTGTDNQLWRCSKLGWSNKSGAGCLWTNSHGWCNLCRRVSSLIEHFYTLVSFTCVIKILFHSYVYCPVLLQIQVVNEGFNFADLLWPKELRKNTISNVTATRTIQKPAVADGPWLTISLSAIVSAFEFKKFLMFIVF